MAPRTPRLGIGRKLVFSLVAVLIVFGLVEGVARFVVMMPKGERLPDPGPGGCAPNTECLSGAAPLPSRNPNAISMKEQHRAGWGFEPGSQLVHGNVAISINSLGLRGAELPETKGSDELRLLSLGDSTVYGYGVREREIFTAVAASQLAASTGRPVLHVNGALPGYATDQAMAVLQDIGPTVQPDWLVIACVWSDLFHAQRRAPPGRRLPFASYQLLVRMLGPWLPPRTIGWWDPERDVGTPAPGRAPRTSLAQYMDNLYALAAHGSELGARSVFVALPAPVDLDPRQVPGYILEYRSAMYTVAQALEAPFVDGPDHFVRSGATPEMFYDQVHPSADGHHLLGEALAAELAGEI